MLGQPEQPSREPLPGPGRRKIATQAQPEKKDSYIARLKTGPEYKCLHCPVQWCAGQPSKSLIKYRLIYFYQGTKTIFVYL